MSKWPTAKLGDVCDKVKTWTPAKEAPGRLLRYVDISSIDRELRKITGHTEYLGSAAPSRARQLVVVGDVLVSTVRPNLNTVARVPADLDGATASTGFTVLRPSKNKLDGSYLYHWVSGPEFVSAMVKLATGQAYPAVSDSIVKNAEIPLPPLDEQRRIAAILDKADALRQKRRQTIAKLDELVQSVFLEMFGDPVTNPMGWPKASIGDLIPDKGAIVDGPFGSTLKPNSYVESGVRVIRNYNINDTVFDSSEFKYVTINKFQEISRSEVCTGDILMTTKGTVGNICLMPGMDGQSVLSASGTVRIRLPRNCQMLNEFMVYQMTRLTYKTYLHGFEGGSIQHYLNLSSIRKMQVVVPPKILQAKFLDVVKKLNILRGKNSIGMAEDQQLFVSLQSLAFSGEL